jgi:malonyl CoA-acyl carrier protein transacylase
MRVIMFPGQGSQHRGMGSALFDQDREYARVEADIDRLLGYSLRELCLEDPLGRLTDTRFTQPALFVVNSLAYRATLQTSAPPDFLMGHSLGEYNALCAAAAFDLVTGVRLVQERGALMANARNGSMMAVIGIDEASLREELTEAGVYGLDIANLNAPMQTVIAGPVEELERAEARLGAAGGVRCIRLRVSAAFHSRYMAQAAHRFGKILASFEFRAPKIPVISNVTALPYTTDDGQVAISQLLTRQIVSPVRWVQSIRNVRAMGATGFQECGPGEVLTNLLRQIADAEVDGAARAPAASAAIATGTVRPI